MHRQHAESGFTLIETMFVVAILGVVSVIAVPMMGNSLSHYRLSGDARGVSNATAVTKMRAASNFSRVRLYADLASSTYHIESLDKTTTPPHWTAEGGTTSLSSGVVFSYGVVSAAPPNTQATIGQAPACVDDDGVDIASTACVMFNSRGVPVDTTFAPTALDAVYLTNGTSVYGVTVAATGMVRMWRTLPVATPSWSLE